MGALRFLLLFFIACGEAAAPPPAGTPVPDAGAEAPVAPPSRPDGSPMVEEPMGILTLNLHCLAAEGFASNAERFAYIAKTVKAEGAIAIAAQEVCKRPGEDAEQMLRAALGAEWSSVWAPAHRAWQGTPDEAEEGLAVFVRGDAKDDLKVTYRAQSALARVMVGITLPGGQRLYSVHFDHQDAPVRAAQARETANVALVEGDLEAIVAGDFNDREGGDAYRALTGAGFRDLSASGGIDHLMAHRGSSVAAASSKVLFQDVKVSDHPGVLVKLARQLAPKVRVTRLSAKAEVGTHWLSVRGDRAPLSWTAGIPARSKNGSWQVVLTEAEEPFRFKFLQDDRVWQKGADVSAAPGGETSVAPEF